MYSLGIYDSGIGGLTTLLPLKKAFPNCDFCFLADTKSNPLGTKTPLEIIKTVHEGLDHLKAISYIQVVACNTASTVVKPRCAYLLEPNLKNLNPESTLILATPATTTALKLNKLGYGIGDTKNLATAVEILAETAFKTQDISVFERLESTIKTIVDTVISTRKIDTIYLGCSHYLYFKFLLKKLYPTINILDGNADLIANLKHAKMVSGNKNTAFDFTLGNQQEKYMWLLSCLENCPHFQDI